MHCPKCGTLIESEDVSYCSRCGFTLGGVRALMSPGTTTNSHVAVSLGGLNLGVVLMFLGVIPPLLAVLTSPIALPAAFLLLTVELVAILLGSGHLLRFFQDSDTPVDVIRSRRKEIALGAVLMYLGSILATFAVAGLVPDSWIKAALTSAIGAVLALLLLSSKWIFDSIRETATPSATRDLPSSNAAGKLTSAGLAKGDLDVPVSLFETSSLREPEFAERPLSVTEDTTRHLKTD